MLIMTPDKDLAQCVRDPIVVQVDRRKDAIIDEAGVSAKFGVRPSQIPDYLALVGDSADGLPGVPAFGAKTTAAVLARYPTIEEIPRPRARLGRPEDPRWPGWRRTWPRDGRGAA